MKNIMLDELLMGHINMPYFHFIGPPMEEIERSLENKKPFAVSVTGIHRFIGNKADVKLVKKILTAEVIRYEEPLEEYGQSVILARIINDEGDDDRYPDIEMVFDLGHPREGYFIFANNEVTFFENNDPDDWWRHE